MAENNYVSERAKQFALKHGFMPAEKEAVVVVAQPAPVAPEVAVAPEKTKTEAQSVDALYHQAFETAQGLRDHDKSNDFELIQKFRSDAQALKLNTVKLDEFIEKNKAEGKFITSGSATLVMREVAGNMYDNRRDVAAGSLNLQEGQKLVDVFTAQLKAANDDSTKPYSVSERKVMDARYVGDATYFDEIIKQRMENSKN